MKKATTAQKNATLTVANRLEVLEGQRNDCIKKWIGSKSEDRCLFLIEEVREEVKAECKENGKKAGDDIRYKGLRRLQSGVKMHFKRKGEKAAKKAKGSAGNVAGDSQRPEKVEHETTAGSAPTKDSLAGILKGMSEGGATPLEVKKAMMQAWAIVYPDTAFLGLE